MKKILRTFLNLLYLFRAVLFLQALIDMYIYIFELNVNRTIGKITILFRIFIYLSTYQTLFFSVFKKTILILNIMCVLCSLA